MEVAKEIKCEICQDSGWVPHSVFQDKIREEYSCFKALLFLECSCRKDKKAS